MSEEQTQAPLLESLPEEKPKKIPKKAELESRITGLESKVDGVVDSMERISELLTKVIDISDHKPSVRQEAVSEAPKPLSKESFQDVEVGYFPPKFRRVIDRILGPDFKADLAESSGSDCILKITVPPEWDCRIGEERKMRVADIRAGLIKKATDVSDVEKWCNLFAANIKKTYPHFSPKSV